MKTPQDTLSLGDVLPRAIGLLPRIPAIVGNIRTALAIKGDDAISLGKIIEQNAVTHGTRTALLFEDRQWTHARFNAQINQFAHYFLAQGIQPGDTVVVFLQNRPELIFMIAAMAKIGAIASLVNPNQRAKSLIHSVTVEKGTHFVIGEELIEAFEEVKAEAASEAENRFHWVKDNGDADCPAGYADLLANCTDLPEENPSTTDKVLAHSRYANVFTSGTTGLPKAAIQTHRKWLLTYYWFGKVNLNFRPDDVIYVPIPFYHTNALIVAWPSAAAAGAAIAMRRKFSTSNFWSDVQKFHASSFIYIGEVCRYLFKAPPHELEQRHRIRKIFGNGLRPDIWKEFQQRFKIPFVCEFYGAADGNVSFTNTLNIPYCVGWSANTFAIVRYDKEQEAPVVNAEGHFERVSKGESGLLLSEISAKLPFDGYVNHRKNQDKIFENVFEKGDRWFNTGDMVRDIGFKHVQFVDRLGDTYRWKGENVSTTEVEEIFSQLPEVASCAVYGVQIPHTDGRAGMATLVLKPSAEKPDWQQLASTLRAELPSYAVPIFIRVSEALETTATHKIKKQPLKTAGYMTDDPVWVLLPGAERYVPLIPQLHRQLEAGELGY